MRELFRILNIQQDAAGIAFVRDTLARIEPNHPAHVIADSLKANKFISDSETVDMFLHAREASFDVAECLDIVSGADLQFQGWYDGLMYHPEFHFTPDSPIYQALAELEGPALWQAMETIVSGNWMHEFIACRNDRAVTSFAVDFHDARVADFVPVLDWRTAIEAGPKLAIKRWNLAIDITSDHVAIIQAIDGHRTIAEIARKTGITGAFPANAIWSLWRMGCVAILSAR